MAPTRTVFRRVAPGCDTERGRVYRGQKWRKADVAKGTFRPEIGPGKVRGLLLDIMFNVLGLFGVASARAYLEAVLSVCINNVYIPGEKTWKGEDVHARVHIDDRFGAAQCWDAIEPLFTQLPEGALANPSQGYQVVHPALPCRISRDALPSLAPLPELMFWPSHTPY
jgi:hypothetical protein